MPGVKVTDVPPDIKVLIVLGNVPVIGTLAVVVVIVVLPLALREFGWLKGVWLPVIDPATARGFFVFFFFDADFGIKSGAFVAFCKFMTAYFLVIAATRPTV